MNQRIETRTEESRDDYCTPPDALAPVLAYGEIILDPCSGPDSIVPARRALFEKSKPHGLDAAWDEIAQYERSRLPVPPERGRPIIFVNPPYSNTAQWVAKISGYVSAYREVDRPLPADVILLVPVRTETDLFQERIAPSCDLICFRKRRVKFLLDGVPTTRPRHASMYVFWGNGNHTQRFYDSFERHGRVMHLRAPF